MGRVFLPGKGSWEVKQQWKGGETMKYLKRTVIAILFLITAVMMNNAIEAVYASSATEAPTENEGKNPC